MRDNLFETLRARAAQTGIALIEGDEAGSREYVVSRWALTKAFPILEAVSDWLELAAGPARVLVASGGADE